MAYSRDPFLGTTERDWRERLEGERERDQQDTRDGSMADGLDELEVANQRLVRDQRETRQRQDRDKRDMELNLMA